MEGHEVKKSLGRLLASPASFSYVQHHYLLRLVRVLHRRPHIPPPRQPPVRQLTTKIKEGEARQP
jgi:hypothetical protein